MPVVVGGDAAIHAPVLVRDDGPKVHEDIQIVEILERERGVVLEEQVDEVDRVDVVRPGPERLGDLHDSVRRNLPLFEGRESFRVRIPFVELVSRSIAVSKRYSPVA